jgi:hypothetical protein
MKHPKRTAAKRNARVKKGAVKALLSAAIGS